MDLTVEGMEGQVSIAPVQNYRRLRGDKISTDTDKRVGIKYNYYILLIHAVDNITFKLLQR